MKKQKKYSGHLERQASPAAPIERARHTPRDAHPKTLSVARSDCIATKTHLPPVSGDAATAGHALYERDDVVALGLMALPVLAMVTAVVGTVFARGSNTGLERLPLVNLSVHPGTGKTAISPPAVLVAGYGRSSGVLLETVAVPGGRVTPSITTTAISAHPTSVSVKAADVTVDSVAVSQQRSLAELKLFAATQSLSSVESVHAISQTPRIDVASIETADSPTDRATALRVVRVIPQVIVSRLGLTPTLPTWEFDDTPQVCRAGDDRMTRSAVVSESSQVIASDAVGALPPHGIAQSLTDEAFGVRLADAAAKQLDRFVIYNEGYLPISYPMGDVPSLFGVCTDVVIRAYRALGIDLQSLVYQSRVGSGDRNIDHRRTRTLRRFFTRNAQSLPVTDFAEDYLPGDVVTYHRPQNSGSQYHIAMVSNEIAPSGRPMIIHNRGWGPQIEDGLFVDVVTGHYRFRTEPNIGPPISQIPDQVPPPVRRDAKLDIRSTTAGSASR